MTTAQKDLDQDSCYRALAARDGRFDGQFYTAVHSTRIYCRPICPARTPKRQGVTFYRSAAAASAAGYRPCLRCRPELAPAERYWHSNEAVTDRLSRFVADGVVDQLGIAALAEKMGYSERHLRRLYVERWGVGLKEATQVRRLHLAKQLLQDSDLPIVDVALAAGFGSVRSFNTAVKSHWGVSPSLFRKQLSTPHKQSQNIRLRLQFRPPFDWPHLLEFLRARSLPSVEMVTEGSYSRVVRIDMAQAKGGEAKPIYGKLKVTRYSDKELSVELSDNLVPHFAEIVPKIRRLFDLDATPNAIAKAWVNDAPEMYALWQRWPGTRVPGVWSPFEVAVRAVLGQQISVKAAITLVTRFVERFGVALPLGQQSEGLTHAFPEPEDLHVANMDGLGITTRRIETIKLLAEGFASGDLDFEMGDPAQQRERLLALKGIGPWTASYMEMRGLANPDGFPAGDLILRRGLHLGTEYSERELAELSQPWRPWRSYAAILLWRHYNADMSSSRSSVKSVGKPSTKRTKQ